MMNHSSPEPAAYSTLVADTNGKNLNRQNAKFGKLDRGLDKREEEGKSCQGRPHESENRNGTTETQRTQRFGEMIRNTL